MSKEYSFGDARTKKVWNFVWLNVLAIGGTLALFYLILELDSLTVVFTAAWRWLSRHQVIMALAASTPFFAALLVGRASAKKARRRREREARETLERERAERERRGKGSAS
jgi:hypothetical protein